MKITFLTSYSLSFTTAKDKLEGQLAELNYDYVIINLDERYANQSLSEDNKFDFYVFKPEIIIEQLEFLSDGDILVWIDANDKPLDGLLQYLEHKFESSKFSILSTACNYVNIKMMHEAFLENSQKANLLGYATTLQADCGLLAVKKGPRAIILLDLWLRLTQHLAMLNTYQKSKKSRHDQEALMLVSKIYQGVKLENWFFGRLGIWNNLRKYIEPEANRHG